MRVKPPAGVATGPQEPICWKPQTVRRGDNARVGSCSPELPAFSSAGKLRVRKVPAPLNPAYRRMRLDNPGDAHKEGHCESLVNLSGPPILFDNFPTTTNQYLFFNLPNRAIFQGQETTDGSATSVCWLCRKWEVEVWSLGIRCQRRKPPVRFRGLVLSGCLFTC